MMSEQYLMLFRGTHSKDQSPQQAEKAMQDFTAWFEGLQEKMVSAHPLEHEGKVFKAGSVSDGPFVESKEVIAGFCLVNVDNLAAAEALANSWPGFKYGMTLELRPVADECPLARQARELEVGARA